MFSHLQDGIGVNRPHWCTRIAAVYLLPSWMVGRESRRAVINYYVGELNLKPELHPSNSAMIITRKVAAARALGHFSPAVAIRVLPAAIKKETNFAVVAAAAEALLAHTQNTPKKPQAREELAAYVLLAPLVDSSRTLSFAQQRKRLTELSEVHALALPALPALRAALRCNDVEEESRVKVIAYVLMASGLSDVVDDLVAVWNSLTDSHWRHEFSSMLNSAVPIIRDPVNKKIGPRNRS
jgi:hypothetical protein